MSESQIEPPVSRRNRKPDEAFTHLKSNPELRNEAKPS